MIQPEDRLKEMSQHFRDTPGPQPARWIREMILYEIYVRNMTDEGTFRGVISHLDRLKNLGINTIWLMPIHPIGQAEKKGTLGCPYSIKDYLDVNPEHGSKEDFRLLVEETHKRGMRIIIDMVINHSSHDNVMIIEHPDWFCRDESGSFTRRRKEWEDVIDNDFSNGEFRKYIKEVLFYWIKEFDIDGYRCDVAGMIPLDFWEEVFDELREMKPDLYFLAEWGHCNLCSGGFNSDYHSDLYWNMVKVRNMESGAQDLVSLITTNKMLYPSNYLPMNFIENHDRERASHILGEKGFMPGASMIFTIPGIPLIYNGQEAGKTRYLSLFDREPIDWKLSNQQTLGHYTNLIKLRKENPVFIEGEVIPLVNSRPERAASYLVKSEKDCLFVLINFSPGNISVGVKFPEYLNYRPGEVIFEHPVLRKTAEFVTDKDTLDVSLRGYGTLVMR